MPFWAIVTLLGFGYTVLAAATATFLGDAIPDDVPNSGPMVAVAAALWPIAWLIVASITARRGIRGWLAVLPKRRTVPEARAREVAE